jgi:hypothetical protein
MIRRFFTALEAVYEFGVRIGPFLFLGAVALSVVYGLLITR